MNKIALITGSSDGIGYAVAKRLNKEGYTVYGLSKSVCGALFIKERKVDVTDALKLKFAVESILCEAGHIDVAVLCAGISIISPAELTLEGDIRHVFDVNVMGTVNAIQAVLPGMKKMGAGSIIIVSSIVGGIPLPYISYYSASKAALNALAFSIGMEAKNFGVSVYSVLPGGTRTAFTMKRKRYSNYVGDKRADGIAKCMEKLSHIEQTGMRPEYVAEAIARLIKKRCHAPIKVIGRRYKMYALILRAIPLSLLQYIVRKTFI